jgi:hypothetical protein
MPGGIISHELYVAYGMSWTMSTLNGMTHALSGRALPPGIRSVSAVAAAPRPRVRVSVRGRNRLDSAEAFRTRDQVDRDDLSTCDREFEED